MSLFIQNNLIRWILQPVAGLSNRIPQRIRDIIFILCGSGIFLFNVLKNTETIGLRYLYTIALNSLLIGIMLLCTLPKRIVPVRFDWKTAVPWLGFTLFMLIAGLTKSADYLADTMLLLVMFPVIFIIWNSTAFSHIVKLLVSTGRMAAIIFFAISVTFFPITGRQYTSCFTNENGFAFFLCSLFVLLLIGFITGRRTSILRWLDLLLIGVCWACAYYSNSRTGQLACLITTACTFLLLLIQEKKRFSCLLLDVLPVVLVIVISVQVVLPAFNGIHNSINRCQKAIITLFEKESTEPSLNTEQDPSTAPTTPGTEPTTPSTEPTTPGTEPTTPSTEPTTPSTEPTTPSISAEEILKDIENIQGIKTSTEGKSLNQFLTGRVDIWKGVLENVTFWGHAVDETFIYDFKGKPAEYTTAHMTILSFAYDYGFLAGVFYLLFNLIAGVKSVGYAMRQPRERWMLAPFAITIAYGCISLVASTATVYGTMIALLYYLIQAPLVISKQKDGVAG